MKHLPLKSKTLQCWSYWYYADDQDCEILQILPTYYYPHYIPRNQIPMRTIWATKGILDETSDGIGVVSLTDTDWFDPEECNYGNEITFRILKEDIPLYVLQSID